MTPLLFAGIAVAGGIGAARQAAWALAGGDEPPAWQVAYDHELEATDDDVTAGRAVYERYLRLQRQLHG